jgi:2-hydroxy-3-keto-5-methylthiopentenyl-1-phosphate phosphatase
MVRTLIQCDFDGTITEEDEAFLLLDAYADGDWRKILAEYREGKISVGQFNSRAFAMIKTDKQTLVDFVRRTVKVRPGFAELVSLCRRSSFRFIVVSNGLDFYIKEVLKDISSENIEVCAAQTWFNPGGLEVKYIGPDGHQLNDGFKEAYTRSFLNQGYRVVYVGNGPSDMPSVRLAHRVFAIGELLELCRNTNLNCMPFTDLKDVVSGLEKET